MAGKVCKNIAARTVKCQVASRNCIKTMERRVSRNFVRWLGNNDDIDGAGKDRATLRMCPAAKWAAQPNRSTTHYLRWFECSKAQE